MAEMQPDGSSFIELVPTKRPHGPVERPPVDGAVDDLLSPLTRNDRNQVSLATEEATVTKEVRVPNPASAWVDAERTAALLKVDPQEVHNQTMANGGNNPYAPQVKEREKEAAVKTMTGLARSLYDKAGRGEQITKEEHATLSTLLKSVKGDVNPEFYSQLNRSLALIASQFETPRGTTPQALAIDKKRGEAQTRAEIDNFAMVQEIGYKVGSDYTLGPRVSAITGKRNKEVWLSPDVAAVEDTLTMIVPGVGTLDSLALPVSLAISYNQITGKTLSAKEASQMGDTLAKLKQVMKDVGKLPEKDQRKEMERIFEIIHKNASRMSTGGGIINNVLITGPALLRDDYEEGILGTSFSARDIDNLTPIFEAALSLLPFGKGLAVGAREISKDAIKFVNNLSSLKGESILTTHANRLRPLPPSQDSIAGALRALPVEIAPNPFAGVNWARGYQNTDVLKSVRAAEEKLAKARVRVGSNLFTATEKEALIAKQLEEITDAGGSVHTALSTFHGADDAGFRMTSMVGHSPQSGWDSAMDALYFATEANLPLDSTVLTRRDLVTGEFTDILAKELKDTSSWIGQPGEYFLKTDSYYKFDPTMRGVFGADQAVVMQSMGGAMSRALFDPASRFSQQMMLWTRSADMSSFAFKEAANSILKSNFMKLRGGSRATVMDVLELGDKFGHEFTHAELSAGIATTKSGAVINLPATSMKERRAYVEARAFNALLYETANKQIRNKLVQDGWQSLYSMTSTQAPSIIKKVTDVNKMPDKIFDPTSGKYMDKDTVLRSGKDVVMLRKPTEDGVGGVYTHRTVGPDEIYDHVPQKTIEFNDGQNVRIYDENWFVRVSEDKMVNGTMVRGEPTVVGVAHTAKEAREAAEKMQAASPVGADGKPTMSYTSGRDEKALKALAEGGTDIDVDGMLFASGRGERLKYLDGSDARILDPYNAMNVGRDVIAGREAWGDYMVAMEQYAKKTWPDNFRTDDNGRVLYVKGSGTTDEFDEASQFWHYIQQLNANGQDGTRFKQNLVRLSERLQDSRTPDWVADPVARAMNRVPPLDPLAFAKSTNFLLQVASSGPRAFALSALQPLFLAGIAPIRSLRAVVLDQHALHIGMLNRDNPTLDSILAGYLKVAGMGSGDFRFYKAAIEGYKMSGLPYAMDSHAFYRGTDFSPALKSTDGLMAEVVKDTVTFLPRTLAAVFRGGEHFNLASSYMVAARRYKDKNPNADWNDPKHWNLIASEARNLALDMTKANDFSYQKGWLSVPSQYVAISHKALALMTTNKTLTNTEKARIWLGAAAVYGTYGIPFGPELVDDALEKTGIDLSTLPKEDAINARNLIHGGLEDLIFNASFFPEPDGTPGSVQFSKSTSMVNGLKDMVTAILDDDKSFEEVMSGPTGSTLSTYRRIAQEVGLLTKPNDMTDPDTLMDVMALFPEIATGWSRFARAQIGMAMNSSVNKNFKPVLQSTQNELWVKGAFGFSSYGEAEAYAMKRDEKTRQKEDKDFVDATSRIMIRELLKYGDDRNAAYVELEKMRKVYFASEYTAGIYMKAFKGNFKQAQIAVVSGRPLKNEQEQMLMALVKGVNNSTLDPNLASRVVNADFFIKLPKEQQDKLRNLVEETNGQFYNDSLGVTE